MALVQWFVAVDPVHNKGCQLEAAGDVAVVDMDEDVDVDVDVDGRRLAKEFAVAQSPS